MDEDCKFHEMEFIHARNLFFLQFADGKYVYCSNLKAETAELAFYCSVVLWYNLKQVEKLGDSFISQYFID